MTGDGMAPDASGAPIEIPPPPPEFVRGLADLGIALEAGDLEAIASFLRRLYEANRRFNLTGIRDPAAAWVRHVLDALTLLGPLHSIEPAGERLRVLDLGSGGGVPGIVLATVLPAAGFTLVEATGKKAAFLRETAAALGLANLEVRAERAERLGHDPALRGQFDAVTARGVAPLATLLEWTVPFLRCGGFLLAIKGERAGEEIEAAKLPLHRLHAAVSAAIPTPTGTIVVVEKLRTTPRAFPRAASSPPAGGGARGSTGRGPRPSPRRR
jgi:16S rRNA (guanine527-N7)-methyltransferase